jgi:hypothetical protein
MTWFSHCVERGERQEFALSPNGSRHIASDAGGRLNGGSYEKVDCDGGAVLCIGERICAAGAGPKYADPDDAGAECAADAGHGRFGPYAADDAIRRATASSRSSRRNSACRVSRSISTRSTRRKSVM